MVFRKLWKNHLRRQHDQSEIIDRMAKDADVSKAGANKALDSFIDSIKKTLKEGSKVTLVGFGTFSVGKRAARKGRNPQTGAVIKIKASKTPKLKAGKAFKDAKVTARPETGYQ